MASLSLGFSPLRSQCSSCVKTGNGLKRLRLVRANAFQHKNDKVATKNLEQMIQSSASAAPLVLLGWMQDTEIARATGVDLVDRPAYPQYTAEQWIVVLSTWGAIGFVYFFVLPPLIYAYLHTRWMKRNKYEAYFHFFLVFFFFPALLLWAPFINLRPLPRDPTKKYPWD